jgi:hypothetical protein
VVILLTPTSVAQILWLFGYRETAFAFLVLGRLYADTQASVSDCEHHLLDPNYVQPLVVRCILSRYAASLR